MNKTQTEMFTRLTKCANCQGSDFSVKKKLNRFFLLNIENTKYLRLSHS